MRGAAGNHFAFSSDSVFVSGIWTILAGLAIFLLSLADIYSTPKIVSVECLDDARIE
jgi:hypothetical protein